jgi:hypothetical protein
MVEAARVKEDAPIYLPGDAKAWEEAVMIFEGKVYLFWNDERGNTRTVVEPLEE